MAIMNAKQKKALREIIYHVESNGNYSSFAGAYANSSLETAITIGAGQWFATEAQKLLKRIRSANPTEFKKLDTAGISDDLDNANWSKYSVTKNSAKGKCIIAIISTATGKKCQDELFDEQMETFMDEAKALGVTSVRAMAMCANFRHQGGKGAVTRILKKTKKPYTLDNLYNACCTDTGNQVGAYKTRQKYVYTHLKSDFPEEGEKTMTERELRQKFVDTAISYLGCKESNGSHRKIIDGYNAVKPLARSYAVKYNDAWCATFVSFVGIKAGITDIIFRECGCGAMITLYQKAGRWMENDNYVPEPGDIIMYDWDDSGSGQCTGYPEHVGIVVSVSGSTIKVIEGNYSNSVKYRNITVGGRYIRGYCLPDFESKATSVPAESKPSSKNESTTSSTNSGSGLNKTAKWTGIVEDCDELNVRTWAGTSNPTVSFSPLKKGTEVEVCDSVKASNGVVWYYIKYKNKYGFVSSKYIEKKVVASTTTSSSIKVDFAQSFSRSLAGTYKVTASDGLNLRAGAGTDEKLILTIPKNGKVTCYGYYTTEGGAKWYLVSYGTRTGFVHSGYLKKC